MLPQQPAPVLISPNSKLFGSKLHATRTQSGNGPRRPENLAITRFLAFFTFTIVRQRRLPSRGAAGGNIGGIKFFPRQVAPKASLQTPLSLTQGPAQRHRSFSMEAAFTSKSRQVEISGGA